MCGGAIISDFIAVKRERNLTSQDLWSELDPFSDLLGFNGGFNNNDSTQKPKPLNKGNFFHSDFVFPHFCHLGFS